MPPSPLTQAQRRAEGRCPLDGKPAAPHVFCPRHRARRVSLNLRARRRRIAAMVCREEGCGNTPSAGDTRCAECKTVETLKTKARADEKAASGICVLHGCERKARGGFRVCASCRAKRRAKYAAAH